MQPENLIHASCTKLLPGRFRRSLIDRHPGTHPGSAVPDIPLVGVLLGWPPKVRLDDGLCRTLDCFENRRAETGLLRRTAGPT